MGYSILGKLEDENEFVFSLVIGYLRSLKAS